MGRGGILAKTNVPCGGGKGEGGENLKTNKGEQGGRWVKARESSANVLFECLQTTLILRSLSSRKQVFRKKPLKLMEGVKETT